MFRVLVLFLVFICHTSEVNSASCGQTTSSSRLGYIRSPNKYGNGGFTSQNPIPVSKDNEYPKDLDCTYDIKMPYPTRIKLTWKVFDIKGYMPTCWPKDYVEIYIGCDRKSIGKYCSTNSHLLFDVYSPDSCLRIKFHSDGSDAGKGFVAYYKEIRSSYLSSSCGNVLKTGDSGTFASPSWPANYPANGGSCYYSIQVGKSKNIKIAFMDFDLEYDNGCDDVKLKIKADDDDETYNKADRTVKDSTCGTKDPFTVTSSEERVYIRFKTGYRNVNKRGFVAGYVLYEPSIHDTGSQVAIIVVCIIVLIVIIGCVVFCYIRKRRAAQRYHQAPASVPMAPAAQSYPTQPQPSPAAPMTAPPPPYGQATAGYPPPGSYPPPGQSPYPPPPPGQSPYPPPGQAPYPPPGQPYPTQGQAPYPPPASAPYPANDALPYPAAGASPYPPPGQAQPYPPPGQEKPYPPL